MRAAARIPAMRAHAQTLMLDRFDAYAPGTITEDADGMEQRGYTLVASDVPGKLGGPSRDSDPQGRPETVGGIQRRIVGAGLHLPVSAAQPVAGERGIGWEYVLTAAGPNTPAELVGSRWLVLEAPVKSHMTARRLTVVEVPAP